MTRSTPSPCVTIPDGRQPFVRRGGLQIEHLVRAHLARERKPRCRRANHEDRRCAGDPGERNSAEPDGPRALYEDGISRNERCALDDVHGRQQTAAATDVILERDRVRQDGDANARLEVHVLSPPAEQALGRGIRDAIHASGHTPRGRPLDGAGATASAGPVHVEEHRAIAFGQSRSVEPDQRSANRLEHSRGHMSWNNRIGNAGEAPVPEVHVGPADFRSRDAQQRRARREIGPREFANLNRLTRRRHHGGKDGGRHLEYIVVSLTRLAGHWIDPWARTTCCKSGGC